jgi:hypothetical protein
MREIRTSGSEGGGIETNRRSLPLSVSPVSGYWIARSSRAMTPVGSADQENALGSCLLPFKPKAWTVVPNLLHRLRAGLTAM